MAEGRKEIVDIRWPSAFGIFGLGVIVGTILCVFQVARVSLSSGSEVEINMAYTDLVAIILTAVAVLVTVLGVGIAIITFIGFHQIKKAAKDAGMRAALAEAKKQFTIDKNTKRLPDPELQAHIESTIEKVAEKIALKINGRPEGFGNENTEYGD